MNGFLVLLILVVVVGIVIAVSMGALASGSASGNLDDVGRGRGGRRAGRKPPGDQTGEWH